MTRSENKTKQNKTQKASVLQRKQHLHSSSKPPPTGRSAVSCVPYKATHPGARALALCPEAASDQEACFSHGRPFLGAYPLLPSVPSVHDIPVSSRDIRSFLPGSVPWRGHTQVHAIPPSPTPTITSIDPVSKLRTPWLSPVSVTPKATTPSGGGIAGTQPRPRAVGRWAVLPSEMSHVPVSGGRVAALLCPGGQSAEWWAVAWGPG